MPNQLKYLALGDSYTIGESVNADEQWVEYLKDLLHKHQYKFGTLDIIAQTGWTTSELQAAIVEQSPQNDYDLVSLLIGVNNQYRGQSIKIFKKEFSELLFTAVQFAKGKANKVFVLSIPDWGVTPFASKLDLQKIASEIDAFNLVAKEECNQQNIAFIDITPLSRTAITDPTLIAKDQLHFSGSMYQQWAELALPEVLKLLKTNPTWP